MSDTIDTSLLREALLLAATGTPVFPCKADKRPACKHSFKDASTDPSVIRELFRASNAVHIGYPTGAVSGIDVLDVDLKNSGDTWSRLAGLDRLTTVCQTMSGGAHYLFRHAPGVVNTQSKLAKGVDTRGSGGYAISYPTIVDREIAAWPADILALLLAPKTRSPRVSSIVRAVHTPTPDSAKQALGDAVKTIEAAVKGERHETIRDVCMAMASLVLGEFLGEDEVHEAIIAAAEVCDAEDMDNVENLWTSALEKASPAEANDGSELGPLPPLEPGEDHVPLDELTEEATARAFARSHAEMLRFDHSDNAWYLFDQAEGWNKDDRSQGLNVARKYVRAASLNPAFAQADRKAATHIRFARAIFDAGMSDPLLTMTATDWNSDPMILGVPGGYVDLMTGNMHPARASDLIRRRTAVAPAPSGTPAPIWKRFLDQATGNDEDMQAYIMRLFGYWLTGDMREEKISFFYGSGGNGKGVLVSTASQIMGEYAYQAPAELFKADSRTNREYQLAMLMGRRLVIASETEAKSMLAESFVKELSGNEGKINARHPYGRPFEFRSVAKLLLVGNHAPQMQGKTAAMERRLQVAPFNHVPASPDFDLKEKLKSEWPAILRMAIDGALAWQQRGLGTCRAIDGASKAYFAEQDTLGQWIEARCVVGQDQQAKSSDALASFNEFVRSRNEAHVDARSFKEAMLRKPGVTAAHTMAGKVYRGLSLRTQTSTSLTDLNR